MAKQVKALVKLQIPAAQATPSPPIGPALGQHGVNIMEFCKAFNAQTQGKEGAIIPVLLTIYNDNSFTFVLKSPPASILLKQAAGIAKGASDPGREKVGKITMEQVTAIAKQKIADLNAVDLDGAVKTILGTARSMGIEVAQKTET